MMHAMGAVRTGRRQPPSKRGTRFPEQALQACHVDAVEEGLQQAITLRRIAA
jgi:hypothetical protein